MSKILDSGYIWVIALACSLTHLCMFSLLRTSGVIYVSMIHTFGITRGQAAWPFSLCMGVYCFIAPVAGVLCQYFSIKSIMMVGAMLISLGVTLCFTATSILYINIFFGVLHGVGMGLMFTMIPVIINQYFKKYKTTALGIAYSGGAVSSIFFPVIFEKLIENYGLRGTFLIVGGIVMHSFVAAFLMRAIPSDEDISSRKNSYNYFAGVGEGCKSEPLFFPEVIAMIDDEDTSDKEENSNNKRPSFCVGTKSLNGYSDLKPSEDFKSHPEKKGEVEEFSIISEILLHVKTFIKVVCSPMFVLICLSANTFFFCFHIYLMVIVDMMIDKGVQEEQASYIISAFSFTDLIGRLCFGWISDKGLIKRKTLAMSNMILVGSIYISLPFASSFLAHIVLACFLGILIGSTVPLFHALMSEYIGPLFPIAVGASLFFFGFIMLIRPPFVGYFRDVIESYNGMFQLLGVLQIAISCLWLIEPFLTSLRISFC